LPLSLDAVCAGDRKDRLAALDGLRNGLVREAA